MDLGNDADELAMALRLGLATVDEAISWADDAIIALDQPPYALIEAACASRAPTDELAELLEQVPGERDTELVARRVLTRMATSVRDGQTTPARAARMLYEMLLWGCSPGVDFEGEVNGLDHAFSLADEGIWGTTEDAEHDLRAFLAPHLPTLP